MLIYRACGYDENRKRIIGLVAIPDSDGGLTLMGFYNLIAGVMRTRYGRKLNLNGTGFATGAGCPSDDKSLPRITAVWIMDGLFVVEHGDMKTPRETFDHFNWHTIDGFIGHALYHGSCEADAIASALASADERNLDRVGQIVRGATAIWDGAEKHEED